MNTNRLISEYDYIYKTFFNKYDIVISSPIVVTLVWDISAFSKNFNFSPDDIEYIVKDNEKWFINQNIENKYPITKKLLNNIWLKGGIWFLAEYNSANPPSILSNLLTLKLLVDKKITIEEKKLI